MSEKRLEFVHTKLVRDSWMYPSMYIQNPRDAIDVIRSLTGDLDREVVTVINLSNKGQVINASFVSMGTINMAPVSAPEVFRSGILSGAASVIALHNHPSGDITPSREDRSVARRLASAGEIVGMKLLDFLVITDKAYYSFKEQEPECLEPREGVYVPSAAAELGSALEDEKAVYNAYERLAEDRKALVTSILEKMKSGDAFFTSLWNTAAISPRNPISGAMYRGGNRLILMNRAIDEGYTDPRWMTFHQLSAKGYAVRKGEKGTRLEKWIFSKRVKDMDENGMPFMREVPLERPYPYGFTVFNASQVEGFPVFDKDTPLYSLSEGKETEEVIDALMDASDCPIHEIAQERSFYRPSTDEIFLPPRGVFRSAEAFAHVLSHEMIHSTGHESRLARVFGRSDPISGPDEAYCIEELRAEIGSLFLCADLGLSDPDFDITNSASYAQHYMERLTDSLKKNPNVLFRAASDAEKACDYIRTGLEKSLAIRPAKEEIPAYEKEARKEIPEKGPSVTRKEPTEAAYSL